LATDPKCLKKITVQLLYLVDISSVQDPLGVLQNRGKFIELLYLQQEKQIVLKESSIAWVHIDAFFVGNLGEVVIVQFLKYKA